MVDRSNIDELIKTEDGSHTLLFPEDGETYHSISGAMTEAEWVYLTLSGAATRASEQLKTRILEIGFSSGLNFVTTAIRFRQANAPLIYHGVERRRLSTNLLDQMDHIRNTDVGRTLLTTMKKKSTPLDLHLRPDIRCTVYFESVDQHSFLENYYDIVYLDAFSPGKHPELWAPPRLKQYRKALNSKGVLVTYSAQGALRRNLDDAGFIVEKHGGPGKKKTITRAIVKNA